MKNVRDYLKLPNTKGLLGVEIEVEGHRLPRNVNGWRRHNDGSLRGDENAEYVLPRPLSKIDTTKALTGLWASFKQNDSHIEESFRAGVHVHLNVQDLTPIQLFTLITLYLVLEGPLTKYCGEDREGNHFCMRSSDAEYLTYALSKAVKDDNMYSLQTDVLRYGALNVTSLFKYGSLEFRAMRSTAKLKPIVDWVHIIAKLKEASLNFADPTDVLHAISAGGEKYFLERVFDEYSYLFIDQPKLNKSIRTGLLNAQDVAYSRDWNKVTGEDLNIFRKMDDNNKFF